MPAVLVEVLGGGAGGAGRQTGEGVETRRLADPVIEVQLPQPL